MGERKDSSPDIPKYLPTIFGYVDGLFLALSPVRCRRVWLPPLPRLYALPLLPPPVDRQPQRRIRLLGVK